jgi:hypothetical protein
MRTSTAIKMHWFIDALYLSDVLQDLVLMTESETEAGRNVTSLFFQKAVQRIVNYSKVRVYGIDISCVISPVSASVDRITEEHLADPLPSNGRLIAACVCFRGNVFTESLPTNRYTGHNILRKSKFRYCVHMSYSLVLLRCQ